jgi:hypothetical protein
MQAVWVGALLFGSAGTAWGQVASEQLAPEKSVQLRRVKVQVSDSDVDVEIQSMKHPDQVYRCRDNCQLQLPSGRYLVNASRGGQWAGTHPVSLGRSAVWEIDPADPEASKNWRDFATIGTVVMIGGALAFGAGLWAENDFDGGSGRGEPFFIAGLVGVGLGGVMIPLGLGLSAQYKTMSIESELFAPSRRATRVPSAQLAAPSLSLSLTF